MEPKSPHTDDWEAIGVMALNPDYLKAMGWFQTAWSALEVNTDFAICALLKVTHEHAHLITSGMTFGPKSQLLTALLKATDHSKRDAIANAFSKAVTGNLRNVFAHGYVATDKDSVTFIVRRKGSKPKTYCFTIKEFVAQVEKFVQAGAEFSDVLHDAFSMDGGTLDEFARAAWEPDEDYL